MKLSTLISTSVLSLSLMLTGCGSKEVVKTERNKEKNSLTVYTTIYPLEDFTKKIGGSYVEVKSIYPPNVDAHSFEPSTKDMVALANSDLFIYTGVGIEGFAEEAAEALKKENVEILLAAEGIELIESTHSEEEHHEEESTQTEEHGDESETSEHSHTEEEHEHGDVDPHVWLDPLLSINLANNIKNSLSELMPEHASEFEANFNQLKSDLENLDQEFKQTVEGSNTKHILVAHSAYGYWEKRYGIIEIPISGLSPTQEPSQKGLQEIITESTEHNIRYVIFEQNVSPKVAEVIQKEIGAESLILHNLEAVTEEDIKQKEDYFSIMRKNLATIKTALND
ncbi:zinc ABC transporter substrate-binding protein [Neobacillus sp. CF12]|uniref:metal ABC transporter solute-binding protein, Zn/Mn family n=1 Tax=Neobacillus sp. CF12 TaxID=3055864 RepID=UPI0025A2BC3F|nr:zinc ABC transporter substrate-binding protein [Neobacillus sp. CF12]MDM5326195.1 zinc ABC transporter substrate-binding protein [Neobacillus sp. CF12]